MKFLVLLAAVVAALAMPKEVEKNVGRGLQECVRFGDPANWLSVELQANNDFLPIISTHIAGHAVGPNFCIGRTEDRNGYHMRIYAQPKCNAHAETFHRTLPTAKQLSDLRQNGGAECGDFDYNAPSCADFAIRQLASLSASTSGDVVEFVETFHRLTQNKDWTVAAASFSDVFEDSVSVQQNVYTDANVCSMTLHLKQGNPVILLAAYPKPFYQFSAFRNVISNKLSAMSKDTQPISIPVRGIGRMMSCPMEEGYWAEVTFYGMKTMSFAGQFQFGRNFCITNSDGSTTVSVRQQLSCVAQDETKKAAIEPMVMKTVARDLTREDEQCAFDYTHGQCINERVKQQIMKVMAESQSVSDVTDRVYTSLSANQGNMKEWAVFVAEMDEHFSIARTARSDASHCFVVHRVNDVTLAVLASKSS